MFGRRVLIADHTLEHDLAKHSRQINLTHFAASILGKYIFGLDHHTRGGIMHLDTKPLFHNAFIKPDSLSNLVEQSNQCVEDAAMNITKCEVLLSRWLFRFCSGAVAKALWDDDSPWIVSEDTMNDLM